MEQENKGTEDKPKKETMVERANREVNEAIRAEKRQKEEEANRMSKLSANTHKTNEQFTNAITSSDYENILTSISNEEADYIWENLNRSNETAITKERASHIFDNCLSSQVFTLCSAHIEDFFSVDTINIGSIIEALLIQKIATLRCCSYYEISRTTINDFQRLHAKLIFKLMPEISTQMLDERVALYKSELNDMLGNNDLNAEQDLGVRIPNLLLYHLYTNPLLPTNNYNGDWQGDLMQHFTFLNKFTSTIANIDAYIKNYIKNKEIVIEGWNNKMTKREFAESFETILARLFNVELGTLEENRWEDDNIEAEQ